MSREQRRMNRRQQARTPAKTTGRTPDRSAPSRRTPVRAPTGGGINWTVIGFAAGGAVLIALIAYLIVQSMGSDNGLGDDDIAERDDSTSLPGVFVASQGRGHLAYSFDREREPRPFCEGVISTDSSPAAQTTGTAAATTSTPAATGTPAAGSTPSGTEDSKTPRATPTVATNCYASNPPSSGQHLNVARNVDMTGNGDLMNIPADPDVYPEEIDMGGPAREAIPHILEHAGVFVGYHCADDDQQCKDAVEDLKGLVNDRIDNHDDRVVMARDTDLPIGEIGLASWTRVLNLPASDYESMKGEIEDFIGTHACRFDPEGFCG